MTAAPTSVVFDGMDTGGAWGPFADAVAAYLTDCARHARLLNAAHHPTEAGALKVIWHRGREQEEQIRAAFRAAAKGT